MLSSPNWTVNFEGIAEKNKLLKLLNQENPLRLLCKKKIEKAGGNYVSHQEGDGVVGRPGK